MPVWQRNQIIEQNIGLAHTIALRARRRLGLDYEEAFKEACIVLASAARGFDPSRGFAFSTYACVSIRPHLHAIARAEARRVDHCPEDDRLVAATAVARAPRPIPESSDALLAVLPERQRFVITRRFGLDGGAPETLERVGKYLGRNKECVRQIQLAALARLRREVERTEGAAP